MTGLQARQNFGYYDGYYYDNWWYTRTGVIVKWSIVLGLLFFFIAFLVGGRWHAMRRIKKGLPPLAYHRWMLSRRQRAIHDPAYRDPQVYYNTYQQPQYGMYPMPPPVYDPNNAPPTYQPPGNAKIDPSQAGLAQPPPVHTHNTGASNNPFRG